MAGPTFTIVGDHPDADERGFDGGTGYRKPEFFTGESSESSSSIGTPDDSDNDEEEEIHSKLKGLGSFDSSEDSLPIKKGLSSHFIGKSKSFTDLSQVNTVKELEKQENPFNKRKRVLIAAKWSRRSFYSWSNPKSMPILPMVDEDQDNHYYDEEEDKGRTKVSPSSSSSSLEEKKPEEDQVQVQLRQLDNHNRVPQSYAAHMRLRLGSFKSRSFSLADLQEHDNEEEEDED